MARNQTLTQKSYKAAWTHPWGLWDHDASQMERWSYTHGLIVWRWWGRARIRVYQCRIGRLKGSNIGTWVKVAQVTGGHCAVRKNRAKYTGGIVNAKERGTLREGTLVHVETGSKNKGQNKADNVWRPRWFKDHTFQGLKWNLQETISPRLQRIAKKLFKV